MHMLKEVAVTFGNTAVLSNCYIQRDVLDCKINQGNVDVMLLR